MLGRLTRKSRQTRSAAAAGALGSRARLSCIILVLSAGPAFASTEAARVGPTIGRLVDQTARAELASKQIPSIAMAVVDRTGVIWSASWGHADAARTRAATSRTVYRAGSVTKLFTDLLVMQLVEQGRLNLDAPITAYLPDFKPINPWNTPITLRQLMAHRSGLVREAPVGNYFATQPSTLAQTVASLSKTTLVAEPGSVTKYSNAGIAVVGRVLEVVTGQRYEKLIKERLFVPLDMRQSGFSVAEAGGSLAYAEMSSYDGGRFPAPVFERSGSAAGGLYTTVDDLAAFVQALLSDGQGRKGRILGAATLASMQQPQYGAMTARSYALGFAIEELDGNQVIGHGGAVYGFSTDLRIVPGQNLGVVVFSTVDAGRTARRLGDYALRVAIAAKRGTSLPGFVETRVVPQEQAARIAGWYSDGQASLMLRRLAQSLFLEAPRTTAEVRQAGGRYYLDDAQTYTDALEIDPAGGWVRLGGTVYRRADRVMPPLPPAAWRGLIGDYGWEHNYIRVYERDGQPYVRSEWIDHVPMRIVSDNRWMFPDSGVLYAREVLEFKRDERGQGLAISLNGIRFPRRDFGAAMQARVRALVRADTRRLEEARNARPPSASTETGVPDLVNLQQLDPTIRLDIRYATRNNFTGVAVYDRPAAFMQRKAAAALVRVNRTLRRCGFRLAIHDAYRPWFVTKMFWDSTPPAGKQFVADPASGSVHNRGVAVDLTLFDDRTGDLVEMPGAYDEMSARSAVNYVGGTSRQRWHRDLLVEVMEAEGFVANPTEWWHFDHVDWKDYPILNIGFDALDD